MSNTIEKALALASKGVQKDDGHAYHVSASDLVAYAEAIRGLVGALHQAWEDGFDACSEREGRLHSPYEDENPYPAPTEEPPC